MATYNGIALIICVDQYENTALLGNLDTAKCDAESMSDCFRNYKYDVRYLDNPDANSVRAVVRRIQADIESKGYRNIFVYYTGHNLSNKHGYYLILSEFMSSNCVNPIDELKINAFELKDLIKGLCEIKPEFKKERTLVVILDTYRGLAGPGLRGQSEEKELQQQKVLDHNCCKHTGFLVNYAFKPRLPTTERVENTENKPDQCSRPGLFTKHILEELRKPGVTIINALSRANQLVLHYSNGEQKPQMEMNFPHMFNFSLNEAITEPL